MQKVAILMASYNGEVYIKKQIQSIIDQSFHNWMLIIRDDGSTDNTVSIIKEFQKIDKRIMLIEADSPYHGPFINFHYLINYARNLSGFDYFFFADQDDLWETNKLNLINKSFNKEGQPELIYTDMSIIDGDDNIIIESNNAMRGIELPNKLQLYFNHSYIWGCTVAINKALLEIVPEINIDQDFHIVEILSHDNYFAKFALEFGRVSFINKQLIKYRRHSSNVSEISKVRVGLTESFRALLYQFEKNSEKYANCYSQTLYMIENSRKVQKSSTLDEIESIIRNGGFKSINYLIKNNIKKNQLIKTLAVYFVFIFGSYKKYLRR
ncbi:TPA: glycosyltransferase family 2 protein [Streptococcus suis]|nr:glycosyltransferase family 2 protein [Streptococcus suis]